MESGVRRRRWWALVAISLGVALVVTNTTLVNVTAPVIMDDLDLGSAQAQWMQESYAVTFAALLLVTGRMADVYGARRVFLCGIGCFSVIAAGVALAPDGTVLVTLRALQGVAAAAVLPASLSLLNAGFRGRERGRAFAVWGATIGAGSAVGPTLGGWLATEASWRWAFGVSVPLGVVGAAGVLAFTAPSPRRRRRIDVVGALLSVAGLGLLAFGLIQGRVLGWITATAPVDVLGMPWPSGASPVLPALVVSGVALGLFVTRQYRQCLRGEDALMEVRLFSIVSFRNGNIAAAIVGLGEFGILTVLPLWLQFALGRTAFETGLSLVALAVGSLLGSLVTMILVYRLGPLGMVRLGMAVEVAGILGLGLTAASGGSWGTVTWWLLWYGVGVGLAGAQVTNVVLADVPAAHSGAGSGVQSAFRQLGTALGIAGLATVFFISFASGLRARLDALGIGPARAASLTDAVVDSGGSVLGGYGADAGLAPVAGAARAAMGSALALTAYVAAAILVAGLIATFRIPARVRVPGPARRRDPDRLPEGRA